MSHDGDGERLRGPRRAAIVGLGVAALAAGCSAGPGPGFLGDGASIELCQGVVEVPDPVLRDALLEVVPQPPRPEDLPEDAPDPEPVIRAELLRSLRGLNVPERGITDLRGLECAQGLLSLGLAGNEIRDVTPLLDLTGLEQLELSSNQVTDLGALSRMFRLTRLALDDNGITDIGPLASLSRLEALDLADNEVSDLEPLSGLSALAVLVLSNNEVSDLEPLSGLLALRGLELDGNAITSLEPLRGVERLRYVDLDDNEIASLEPLAAAVDMQEIEASRNALTSLAGVEGMATITRIVAQQNAITTTDGVAGLAQLSTLDLGDNQVASLDGVQTLRELQTLRLALNRVTDLSALTGLPELRNLDLRSNEGLVDLSVVGTLPLLGSLSAGGLGARQDLSALAGRTVLRALTFAEAEVVDLGFFAELPTIEAVNFAGTPLSAADLAAIAQAGTLQSLVLDRTGISELAPLEALTLVETLVARDNALTRLDSLAFWLNLTTVRLGGNPLVSLEGMELLERLSEFDLSDSAIADLGPVAASETFRRGDTLVVTGTAVDAGDCPDIAIIRGREAIVETDLECP